MTTSSKEKDVVLRQPPCEQALLGDKKERRSGGCLLSLAQLLIVLCFLVYALGQLAVALPVVQFDYFDRIMAWWSSNITSNSGSDGESQTKHFEMTRPTFLTLYCVVPFWITLVIVEWLRGYNLHRMTSKPLLKTGSFLRRKPNVYWYVGSFTYGELLFFLVYVGGNVSTWISAWLVMRRADPQVDPRGYEALWMIGTALANSCLFNLAFLFIPATRNSAWMEFAGISYPNGMKFHRWAGVLTIFTAFGHGIPYYFVWAHEGKLKEMVLPCFNCKLDYSSIGYEVWFNVFGQLALLCFVLIGITSIPQIRRRMYNLFYYVHHLFPLAVLFACLHVGFLMWWILPTFLLYLTDRIISNSNAFTPVQVSEFTCLPDDILRVTVRRSSQHTQDQDRDEDHPQDFSCGQFVYLNVPVISRLQWHPFSIASSSRADPNNMTIYLKVLGDWTESLMKYAAAPNSSESSGAPTIYLDGYYGTALEYQDYPTVSLIAGGIGGTPLFGVLEEMAVKLGEGRPLLQRVHLLFTFRELCLMEILHPTLQRIRQFDPNGEYFTFEFYMTRAPSEALLQRNLNEGRTLYNSNTQSSAQPFIAPLRSRGWKSVLYLGLFATTTATIGYLRYGEKLMDGGAQSQYWPLQNLVECLAMFFLPPVFVYAFILVERVCGCGQLRKRKQQQVEHAELLTTACESESQDCRLHICDHDDESLLPRVPSSVPEVTSYRDLISTYQVTVGKRPDVSKFLHKAFGTHQGFMTKLDSFVGIKEKNNKIGVFISGPVALKNATEYVVHDLGTSLFDVHSEEYEL